MLRGSDRAAQENYIRDEYTLEFLGALNLNPRSLFSLWTLSAINKKEQRTRENNKTLPQKEQRTREN